MLVEIADQAGSEKLKAVKTKNQEGRLRVTICLRKKSGEKRSLPLLDVAGGDKEVAGRVSEQRAHCRSSGFSLGVIADI